MITSTQTKTIQMLEETDAIYNDVYAAIAICELHNSSHYIRDLCDDVLFGEEPTRDATVLLIGDYFYVWYTLDLAIVQRCAAHILPSPVLGMPTN
jgi:hypothetical protein